MEKEVQAAIGLAKKNLMDFCVVTDYRYAPNFHHVRIAEELQLVEEGKVDRLIITLPPRHGKSELASVKFPAWYLGRHPDNEIITASYSSDLAVDFSKKVRNLINSPEYGSIFETRLAKDSKAADRWHTQSGKGGFVASGVGGSITGRGANVLIIDDPLKNRLEASSDVIRNKVYDWYTSTALTRLEKNGAVILIMCMTGDTQVLMANGAVKELRNIRIGDKISTYENGKLSTSTVKNWVNHGKDKVFTITTSSGKIVKANKRHPFLIYNNKELKWVRVENLTMGQKIVTLKGNGVSGEVRSVSSRSVKNKPVAEGIAHPITEKRSGLMDTVLHHIIQKPVVGCAVTHASNVVTALLSKITKGFLRSKAESALYVENLPDRMCAPIGVESSALTTAMKQEKLEGCSVMIATLRSVMLKLKRLPSLLRNTSDFTLDEIISIEETGVEEVFDIQVDRTENFIANGVVSHNTRWHDDDLAGRLLEKAKETGEKWRVVNFPAIAVEDEEYRKIGEALWEDKYDLEALERIRTSIGPRDWTALYMQEPIDAGTATFSQEMFRYYTNAELDGHIQMRDLKIVTAIDPALATKQSECYGSLVTIGVDKYYNIFVLDTIFGHFSPDKILDLMFQQAGKWQKKGHTYRVVIEDVQFQKMLILEGRKQQILRKHRFSLSGIKPRGEKIARIKSTLQTSYSAGRIYHKESLLELENELVRFPVGKIDVVDALAMAVQVSDVSPMATTSSYAPMTKSLKSELEGLFESPMDGYIPDGNYNINQDRYV